MIPQFDLKQPETPAEADSLVGVASTDLFAALVRRHNLAVNDLSETQLAEALRQAMPDFRRLVHVAGQQVIYVPYQEADRWKALYHELLWSVESVHEGETRHETALRYIRERETHSSVSASDSSANSISSPLRSRYHFPYSVQWATMMRSISARQVKGFDGFIVLFDLSDFHLAA